MIVKHPLINLLTLRASYNKNLHDAILSGDAVYVENYVHNYDNDDRDFYDFEHIPNITALQKSVKEADAEYAHAFATGQYIMGM